MENFNPSLPMSPGGPFDVPVGPPTDTEIKGSLGASDNVLVRSSGTSGSLAKGSSVTLDDSANLSTTNWTVASGTYSGRTYAQFGSVAANLALVLSPTGTGFISATVPNGAAAGGNNRGNNAVDLTMVRSAATQVASGAGAFQVGPSATSSGTSSVAIGDTATATGSNSIAIGNGALALTSFGCAIGTGCRTDGTFGFAHGFSARALNYAQDAHSAGVFASIGDSQCSRMVARVATSNATPTSLFLDGSTQRISVQANSSGTARIMISARTATAGAQTMTWNRLVAWQRGVAAATTTVDVQTIGTDRGYTGGAWGAGPAWAIAITADTTNGAIDISVTGVAATNIRWDALIDWIEVTYA